MEGKTTKYGEHNFRNCIGVGVQRNTIILVCNSGCFHSQCFHLLLICYKTLEATWWGLSAYISGHQISNKTCYSAKIEQQQHIDSSFTLVWLWEKSFIFTPILSITPLSLSEVYFCVKLKLWDIAHSLHGFRACIDNRSNTTFLEQQCLHSGYRPNKWLLP